MHPKSSTIVSQLGFFQNELTCFHYDMAGGSVVMVRSGGETVCVEEQPKCGEATIEVSGNFGEDSCRKGGSGMKMICVIEVDDEMKWMTR